MSSILIVDDEPVIREVLAKMLARTGRILLVAASAAEALKLAGSLDELDLTLVDKNLPDCSGIELIGELKRQHPDSEVIVLTGYATIASAIEAIKVGVYDYVTKPVDDFEALNNKVNNAIEKAMLRREQRGLAAHLRDSEERYRAVFAASLDGILVVDDASGIVRDANTAAERLYGQALVGCRFAELLSTRPVEVTTGSEVVHGASVSIHVVRDVSEREEAEARRRMLEEHLRQSQKMEAVGRLAGGVAHDFNNLLMVILGNCEILGERLRRDQAAFANVDDITNAATRAAKLTSRLLSFSRHKPSEFSAVDVNQAIADMGTIIRRTLAEDIEIVVRVEPSLWPVRIDDNQLGQVLLNLAVNARDAMAGGGKLLIETKNVVLDDELALSEGGLVPGRYVCLTVSDNGVGMSDETKARIFEPFFTTKPVGKGTGLGLATVYGIVTHAGGRIRVYSEPGVGTSFRIYLPRTDVAVDEAAALPEAPERPAGRGETILVAEDDASVRALVRGILSHHGYRVLESSNGEEALRAAAGHSGDIHLLVTDVIMPRLSGKELARRLGELRPNTRVLFMSGYTDHAVVELGLLGGSVEFLQKPFDRESLLARVRGLIELPQ